MEITPAWNTWDSVYPAQMTYLPLGLTVTPCAYAASTGTFTTFPATAKGLSLGEREVDGSSIKLHLVLSGTELDWHYEKPSATQLRGGWEATKFGAALQAAGVDTLILSGVETDVCVWATALDAVDLGYFVVLARDALTSGTPEAHQAVLDILAPRFAPQVSVMNHAELEAAWK